MIALIRGRKIALGMVASASLVTIGAHLAHSQTPQKPGRASTTTPSSAPANPGESPRLQEVRVPINASDPIAIVNGQIITRQQLADECVARKGQEILDTLVARMLIEQAMRGSKLEVTAAEIDAEIDAVAWATAKADREKWLRILDKERGISPVQYARDIIYPALALKKLAAKRVQITPQDLKEAYQANFGERLRCRMIMVDNIRAANEVWAELQRNPGGFERLAKERSTDSGSRALGGMLPEPIARYASPREVSIAVFKQLVDGNPDDRDSKGNPIKPKDGAFTGPIQLHEAAWLIIKREELIPAKGGEHGKFEDPLVQSQLKEIMFEVKQNEAVTRLFEDLMRVSTIDNKLTGQVKMANEEQHPEFKGGLDEKVKRMSEAGESQAPPPTGNKLQTPSKPTTRIGTAITPNGVPTSAAGTASQLQNTIKNGPPGSSAGSPNN
jgi:hypothetical protein